jgi:hypothetical protein
VSFTVLFTVSVTFLVVSLTVSETLVPEDDESLLALAEADGVGVGLALDVELPPVKMLPIALPKSSSRPPLLADAEGLGVAVSLDVSLPELAEADGVGVALSSEPESDEEVFPESEEPEESFDESAVDDGEGVALSSDLSELAEADGDGEADESPSAATQSLYSSAVRLFDDGDVEPPLSARASEDVNPIPMRTAVGIATVAIALPAGMWNLVNSGFLGAAWRGPVLPRDSSTSVPWVTSSAGTVPPVRPVRRARS